MDALVQSTDFSRLCFLVINFNKPTKVGTLNRAD
jgi:hypothetical protein